MTFRQRSKTAWGAIHDPIKTDRSIDVACIVAWICYAFFGLFTITQNASVFTRAGTPEFYQTIWGGSIGLLSALAAGAGILSFYTQHERYDRRIAAKRTERFAVGTLIGLVTLYPLLLAFYGGPTGPRLDLLSLSFSYLVLPIWRSRHLKSRINQLYQVAELKLREGQR